MRLEDIFKRLTGASVFVRDMSEKPRLEQLARGSGFRTATINAEQTSSKKELLSAFAVTLKFPDYFGHNWDALEECVRDLSWLPPSNLLLVFENADLLLNLGAKDFTVLISILGEATFAWKAQGLIFCVVLLGGPALMAALENALEAK